MKSLTPWKIPLLVAAALLLGVGEFVRPAWELVVAGAEAIGDAVVARLDARPPRELAPRPEDLTKFPRASFQLVVSTGSETLLDTSAGTRLFQRPFRADTVLPFNLSSAQMDTLYELVIRSRWLDSLETRTSPPSGIAPRLMLCRIRFGASLRSLDEARYFPPGPRSDEQKRRLQFFSMIRRMLADRLESAWSATRAREVGAAHDPNPRPNS